MCAPELGEVINSHSVADSSASSQRKWFVLFPCIVLHSFWVPVGGVGGLWRPQFRYVPLRVQSLSASLFSSPFPPVGPAQGCSETWQLQVDLRESLAERVIVERSRFLSSPCAGSRDGAAGWNPPITIAHLARLCHAGQMKPVLEEGFLLCQPGDLVGHSCFSVQESRAPRACRDAAIIIHLQKISCPACPTVSGREYSNSSLQQQKEESSLLMGIPSVWHTLCQRLSVFLQAKKKPKAWIPSVSAGKSCVISVKWRYDEQWFFHSKDFEVVGRRSWAVCGW